MQEELKTEEMLQKLYRYCSAGEKCEYDIRRKVTAYNISEEEIQQIIKKLESENFINKDRYIQAFINDKFRFNKWGKLKIVNELRVKNFERSIIDKYLNDINYDEYLSVLNQLLTNKLKQLNNKDVYSRKAALVRFAQSRGFAYEEIEKAIKIILSE